MTLAKQTLAAEINMRNEFTSRQRRLIREATGKEAGEIAGGLASSIAGSGPLGDTFDSRKHKPDEYPNEAEILKRGLRDEYLKIAQAFGIAVSQGNVGPGGPKWTKDKMVVTAEEFLRNEGWYRSWYAKNVERPQQQTEQQATQKSQSQTKPSAEQTTQAMNSVYDNLRSMQQIFQGPLKSMWKEYENTLSSVAKLKSAVDKSISGYRSRRHR